MLTFAPVTDATISNYFHCAFNVFVYVHSVCWVATKMTVGGSGELKDAIRRAHTVLTVVTYPVWNVLETAFSSCNLNSKFRVNTILDSLSNNLFFNRKFFLNNGFFNSALSGRNKRSLQSYLWLKSFL